MITSLIISPNNKHVLTGSMEGILHVVDLERKELLGEIITSHKGDLKTSHL